MKTVAILLCIMMILTSGCSADYGRDAETVIPNSERPKDDVSRDEVQERAVQEALAGYKDFLQSDEMYRITATREYPRGDSRAVYTFIDINGDGIPELHIDGADRYHIYTCREGEVTSVHTYDRHLYKLVQPLADGGMLAGYREAWDQERFGNAALIKPDFADDLSGCEPRVSGAFDRFYYHRLDLSGQETESDSLTRTLFRDNSRKQNQYLQNGMECSRAEWYEQLAVYEEMANRESASRHWEYVFPAGEWHYLDVMEQSGMDEFAGNDSIEWSIYESILSGDFSSIPDFHARSSFVGEYRLQLDRESGRCPWNYMLRDCNEDGFMELFICRIYWNEDRLFTDRYEPWTHYDYFAFRDERMLYQSPSVDGETYIPLSDGRIIYVIETDASLNIQIGRLQTDYSLVPEETYEVVKARSGSRYPDATAEETDTYFVMDHNTGMMIPLTDEAWDNVKNELNELQIPAGEWKPASVFMPDRYPVFYPAG